MAAQRGEGPAGAPARPGVAEPGVALAGPGQAAGPPLPGGPFPAAGGLAAGDLDERAARSVRQRRLAVRLLVIGFVGTPAVALLMSHGLAWPGAFLIPATGAYLVLLDRFALTRLAGTDRLTLRSWLALLAVLGLAAGMFAVGDMGWLTPFAVASAAVGRFIVSTRVALLRVAACGVAGAGIAAWQHLAAANVITAAVVPVLAGLLAHNAERRSQLITRLQETRAELARMAVAEERLRIARDLHDLLGHSLSLIALKAELAGRVIGADPGRAAREVAELETVARRSLTEVRQAVTSYRQPSLAAELAAARRMLASAGIGCRVRMSAAYSLPPDIDALLAWTVREGATNVVRHAGARSADIEMTVTGERICATLTDDGAGPPVSGTAAGGPAAVPPAAGGAGLAGLAERTAGLGGTLEAGRGAGGGFRLRVCVPLTGPAAGSSMAANGARASETGPAAGGAVTGGLAASGPAGDGRRS